MPPYEFVGTVKALPATQTFPSGFTKREVVVTSEEDRFPQDIAFEFVKDKISLLDGIAEADRVTVSFDLRGREYNGRHYVSVSGWKIEKAGATPESAPPAGRDSVEEALEDLTEDMPF